jgi:acylphosphatase
VRHVAADMGLEGTVRNLSSGQVEVVARGPADVLARLEEWLRQGPPGARVTELEGEAAVLPPDIRGFQITY